MTDPAAPIPPEAAVPTGPAGPSAAPAQPWTAPAAPPFGAPTAYRPAAAAPDAFPAYGPPSIGGGVYAPPPGYAGPYVAPGTVDPRNAPDPVRRTNGSGLGIVAFVVSIVAATLPAIAISIATFRIGLGAGRAIASRPVDVDFDWSVLTPVRDWVLLAESSFWVGTALGVWAIVQGIVAVVKNRGRGFGIAAIIVSVVAAILFAVLLQAFLTAGLAAGTSVGG